MVGFQLLNANISSVHDLDPKVERILKKTHQKSYFEKNIGQWDELIIAQSKSNHLSAQFYKDKVSFLVKSDDKEDVFVYNMGFKNISPEVNIQLTKSKAGKINYLGCIEEVPIFEEIRYLNIFPEIDLRFYTNHEGNMEFDYIVHPGGDPTQIGYELEGVESLSVDQHDFLTYCSPFGLLKSGKTFTYQGKKNTIKEVYSEYVVDNGVVRFKIDDYDLSKPLIIDPTVFEWSTYIGGVGASVSVFNELFLDGESLYLCGLDTENSGTFDYPTTPGSYPINTVQAGARQMVVSKFDTTGNLIFSTYLPINGNASKILSFDFDDSSVFFAAAIDGTSSFNPGISPDAFDTDLGPNTSNNLETLIGRLDENGILVWSTFLGGSGIELLYNISVADGILAIAGTTNSVDFPFHNPKFTSFTGQYTNFVSKFDYGGNILYSSFLGKPGGEYDQINRVKTQNGYVALVLSLSNNYTFPVSQNPSPQLNSEQYRIFINILDENNNDHYTTLYNNEEDVNVIDIEFSGNQLCVLSYQEGDNGFVTPGAFIPDISDTEFSMHLYCVDVENSDVSFATYVGDPYRSERGHIEIENDHVYYVGMRVTQADANTNGLFLQKFEPDGELDYFKEYNVTGDALVGFHVDNGSCLIYVNAIAGSTTFFPTEDAAQLFPLNTNLSSAYLFRTNSNGDYEYGSWISGLNSTELIQAVADGEIIYFMGQTLSGFPTTVGAFQTEFSSSASINPIIRDYIVGKINIAPCIDDLEPENIISPSSFEVCKNATVPFITGTDIAINIDSITHYLINGILTPASNNFVVEYQWQINFAGTMNWIDISGATNVSHQPQPLTNDANFRRIAILQYGDCDFRDTSNISLVDVNSFDAPQLPNDTVYYKCASSSIQLNVTAQGGTAPLSYEWTPSTGLSDPFSPTPTTDASVSTIYNVEVTDNNGCVFIEQYTVRVYDADAGDEKINCIGTGVQIGTPHIAPGVPGFRYFWTPSTGLSNTNVAQPIASPSIVTNYTLTIIGPDNCIVTDDVEVNPVQTIADAGEDITYCFDGSVQIGEPNDDDYTFVWSPGIYLDNQQLSNPTVSPVEIPNPNPFTYILTKIHDQTGCTDTDTVLVYVNRAEAGLDFCGPRYIGFPDHSSGMANFSWSVLSGDFSSIVGQENIPRPYVSPSSPTTYQLDVEWNGVVCTDVVFVPNCGCLIPDAEATSDLNCPVGAIEYNTIVFGTSIDTSRYDYLWSPSNGIPDVTNPYPQNFTATLTTATNYTLTSFLKANSSVSCSSTVTIYPPPAPFPFAHAVDTITCIGEGVNIGGPTIPGWTASWTPDNGTLNQINIFNPIATTDETATFYVTIEENSSECQIKDTAVVEIFDIIADAGDDDFFCENAIVQLGTEAIPGLTYSWEPSEGLENNNSAQPIDTLFASTTYYLTVSDSSNTCLAYDTLVYTVVSNPVANAGEDVSICEGAQGIQIGTPSVSGSVYLWAPSSGLSDPNIAQPIANPSTTTTYTLTVSNNANGCFSTDAITINLESSESVDAGPTAIGCVGDVVQIGLTMAQSGYSFIWEPSTGLDNPNIAQPNVTILDTITYTVTMTAPSGCMVQDQVEVLPSIPIADAGDDEIICQNTDIILGTTGLPGYSYSWSPATGLNNPNIAQPTLTATVDIIYTLTATDENNCSIMDDVSITVEPISSDAGPDESLCSGSVQIGTTGLGPGYTYSWSPSGSLSNATIPNPNASPAMQTTYTLTTTHVASGCKATDQVTVTPTAIADSGPDKIICEGETTQIGTSFVSGSTYSWTPTGGLDNPNSATPTVNISSTKTYTLQVSNGGCISIDQVTVYVNPFPEADVNEFEVVCANECVEIGTTEIAGYRYRWSPSDYLSNPNIANPTACPLETTTYTLEVTDLASGCKTNAEVSVDVSDDFAITPSAGPDKEICLTESTTIGVSNQSPAYTYAWNPTTYLSSAFESQTDVNLPYDAPGEYTYVLTATNINTGCEGRDTVLVTLHDDPFIPLIPNDTICKQGSITLCQDCTPNPNYIYEWTPRDEVVNPDSLITAVTLFNTTLLTLSVSDKNTGCNNSNDIIIYVNEEISPKPDAGSDITICIDESTIIGGSDEGYEYEWFPEEYRSLLSDFTVSEPNFTPDELGDFTLWVEAYNSEGCHGTDTIVVSVLNDATIDAGTSFFTCSTSATLNASIIGADGVWSVFSGPNNPEIVEPDSTNTDVNGLIPGEYKFAWSVNSNNVCNFGDLELVTVQVYEAPEFNVAYECEIVNNQSQFSYSFNLQGNGLNGTYNVSGFEDFVNLNYDQQYGPFGPYIASQPSYELIAETSFSNCDDVTEIFSPNCIEFDFGDLPDLGTGTATGDYETLAENNGPRHGLNVGLKLASQIDTESQGQQSPDALGDGDDEDGFPYLNFLEAIKGVEYQIPFYVTNTTGQNAYLKIWVDWNADGDFEDPNEFVADLVDDGAGDYGQSHITLLIPDNLVDGSTVGFRARLSTENNLSPYGEAGDGEVEDYLFDIIENDEICLPLVILIEGGG